MNIFLNIVAALIYTMGAYCMKQSDGIAQLSSVMLVFVLFCLGATCQMFAMRQQDMSGLYIIVLGLEAVCAFLVGAVLLGEVVTWQKIAGAIVIGVGVLLLRQ